MIDGSVVDAVVNISPVATAAVISSSVLGKITVNVIAEAKEIPAQSPRLDIWEKRYRLATRILTLNSGRIGERVGIWLDNSSASKCEGAWEVVEIEGIQMKLTLSADGRRFQGTARVRTSRRGRLVDYDLRGEVENGKALLRFTKPHSFKLAASYALELVKRAGRRVLRLFAVELNEKGLPQSATLQPCT